MSLSSSCELSGHIIVKTDRTSGYDANVAEEVVFMGIAFSDASAEQPASDAGADLVDSDDPSEPWCYDKSRENLLELAHKIRKAGHLQAFGLDGPAVKYAIPGIPVPKDSDGTGNQKHDRGGHLSLWVKPGNGAPYKPPDLAKALKMKGQQVKLTLLPPPEGIKIYCGSESNDMETGICYYIALTPDDNGSKVCRDLKTLAGLEVDARQVFHLSLAGVAPAWQKVHPKSKTYRNATDEQRKLMNLQEDFRVFRRGIADGFTGWSTHVARWISQAGPPIDFVGFNADGFTGWSTHVARCAAAGQETDAISKTVAELEKQRAEIDEILSKLNSREKAALGDTVTDLRAALDGGIAEMNTKKENIMKELPKFAKAISYSDANMLKNAVPNTTAQEQIMTLFGNKQYLA